MCDSCGFGFFLVNISLVLFLADLDGVAVVFECLDDSLCLVDGVCFCERGDVDGVCCCPAVGENEFRFILCWKFFCF